MASVMSPRSGGASFGSCGGGLLMVAYHARRRPAGRGPWRWVVATPADILATVCDVASRLALPRCAIAASTACQVVARGLLRGDYQRQQGYVMSKPVHRKSLTIVAGAMVASLALLPGAGADKKSSGATAPQRGTVDKLIGDWSARPRVAALEMIEKYGLPQEATSETLVWRDAGPFKRIMVTRAEIPHDFPRPHMDYLEHTLAYDVPASKLDDLAAFDGSIT